MGEGGGGEEKGRPFSPSALSLFRFHFSPSPQKRLILRLEDKRRLDTVGWLLGSWLSLGDNAGTRPSLFVVIYKNNGS